MHTLMRLTVAAKLDPRTRDPTIPNGAIRSNRSWQTTPLQGFPPACPTLKNGRIAGRIVRRLHRTYRMLATKAAGNCQQLSPAAIVRWSRSSVRKDRDPSGETRNNAVRQTETRPDRPLFSSSEPANRASGSA